MTNIQLNPTVMTNLQQNQAVNDKYLTKHTNKSFQNIQSPQYNQFG